MHEGWCAQFVAELCAHKRDGRSFDAAWKLALRSHPPRPMDLGLRGVPLTLEGEALRAEAVEWYRGVCEAAWHDWPAADGRRSALRHIQAAFDVDWVSDGSRDASRRTSGGARLEAAA